jgi:acetyl esterase/lipase
MEERIIYQPLDPSLRDRLDPEYVAWHESVLQYLVPSEAEPWDSQCRFAASPFSKTGQRLVDVGQVIDKDAGDFQVRAFIPEGEPISGAWPCLVWFHGGGWVLGGLDSENGFLRHVCKCEFSLLASHKSQIFT